MGEKGIVLECLATFVLETYLAGLMKCLHDIVVVVTPPLPWDEGTAKSIFPDSCRKLKLDQGKSGSPFRISHECKLLIGNLTANKAD